MRFNDVLIHLPTYPDPATDDAVRQAVDICGWLGGQVRAALFEVEFRLANHPLADAVLHIGDMARAEEQRCRDAKRVLEAEFMRYAHERGLAASILPAHGETYQIPDMLAAMGRTSDICVMPYGPGHLDQRVAAEAIIFGSGRPVLLVPPREAFTVKPELNCVEIAWDGGRAAARAVADAMPLLTRAAEVRILSVFGPRGRGKGAPASELVRHLGAHGVAALVEEVETKGDPEERLLAMLKPGRADLAVMGAFARSGVREFLLGGATDAMLDGPPIPVLLAH
jgi:nucleotide-binding universal stress UspA family protein